MTGSSRNKVFLHNVCLTVSNAIQKGNDVPLWLPVEQGTGRVDVDHLLVDEGPVALLGVLLGGVPEETTADGLLHAHRGLPTRHHIQLMSGTKTSRVSL